MPDPYPQLAALVVIGLIMLAAAGSAAAHAISRTDTWVIVRGETRGRYHRARRALRRVPRV